MMARWPSSGAGPCESGAPAHPARPRATLDAPGATQHTRPAAVNPAAGFGSPQPEAHTRPCHTAGAFLLPSVMGSHVRNSAAGGARGPKGPPVLWPVFQPRTVRHPVWKRGGGLSTPEDRTMKRHISVLPVQAGKPVAVILPGREPAPCTERALSACGGRALPLPRVGVSASFQAGFKQPSGDVQSRIQAKPIERAFRGLAARCGGAA